MLLICGAIDTIIHEEPNQRPVGSNAIVKQIDRRVRTSAFIAAAGNGAARAATARPSSARRISAAAQAELRIPWYPEQAIAMTRAPIQVIVVSETSVRIAVTHDRV